MTSSLVEEFSEYLSKAGEYRNLSSQGHHRVITGKPESASYE
jgi:hypothetical protein